MKETHLFTSEEKIEWLGYGEWVEEPDLIGFYYRNHECRINRIPPMGYLCSYVALSKEEFNFYEKNELDIDNEVHGGITFRGGTELYFSIIFRWFLDRI